MTKITATATTVRVLSRNADEEYPVEVDGTVVGFVYRLGYKHGAVGWAALTLDGKRAAAIEFHTRREAVAALLSA